MLHGRMKAAEKEQIMKDFQSGELQLLVSTTVIEVGVDVPNATVMLIQNAEQFGLSQLHQLRGRVGRGGTESFCILVSAQTDSPRLRAICQTNDGFRIAEEDLKLRGPGDFFRSEATWPADDENRRTFGKYDTGGSNACSRIVNFKNRPGSSFAGTC